MSIIPQAVLFDKDYYTKRSADQWLKRHNLNRIKALHETLNYYRARLIQPNENVYNYRIKKIKDGLKFVLQYPKY